MQTVIKVLAIIFMASGVIDIVKPALLRPLFRWFAKGCRVYLAGIVRFALAVVFLIAAKNCAYPRVIVVFGVLFLLSGLLIFLLGPKRVNAILQWFNRQPDILLRVIGVVVLALGGLLLYSA